MPIDGGLRDKLETGTVLVASYKKQQHTAEVVTDAEGNKRYRLGDGREFKSPSAAGSAVMQGVAYNGWRFWSLAADARATKAATREDRNAEACGEGEACRDEEGREVLGDEARAARDEAYVCAGSRGGACGRGPHRRRGVAGDGTRHGRADRDHLAGAQTDGRVRGGSTRAQRSRDRGLLPGRLRDLEERIAAIEARNAERDQRGAA